MQSLVRAGKLENATEERGMLTLSCTMPSGGPVKLRDVGTLCSKQDKVMAAEACGRHGNGGSTGVLFTYAAALSGRHGDDGDGCSEVDGDGRSENVKSNDADE